MNEVDRDALRDIAEQALDIANEVLEDESVADRTQNRGHIVGALINVMGAAYFAEKRSSD